VTADDVENALRGPFCRDRQLESTRSHGLGGERRYGDGDERVEKDGAIMVVGSNGRSLSRVVGLGVTGPMRVNRATVVVRSRVIIRMRVEKRSAQGRRQDGQRQRDRDDLPQDVSLLLTMETTSRDGCRYARPVLQNLLTFGIAAVLEIAGCFAFWVWLRRGASPLVVLLGVASLIGFAVALTRVDAAFAGRAYAAYGGIYIVASLCWLWLVEGQRPSGSDLIGAGIAIAGTLIIISLAPKPR
jgi:small multidrug resistance family-3 protein